MAKKENSKLVLTSSFGLMYFILSICVVVAVAALAPCMLVFNNFALCWVLFGLCFAYCGALLVCEILRNKQNKDEKSE